jgi:hypothetical protein
MTGQIRKLPSLRLGSRSAAKRGEAGAQPQRRTEQYALGAPLLASIGEKLVFAVAYRQMLLSAWQASFKAFLYISRTAKINEK